MKKGFTLAEVLITLAIIGVVAALTIPSILSHNQQMEFKTGLRKAVSVLNSAIQANIAYDGETPYDVEDLANYLMRRMSVTKAEKLNTCYSSDGKYLQDTSKDDGKQFNCKDMDNGGNVQSNATFYTTDGMRFEVAVAGATSRSPFILHESGLSATLNNRNNPYVPEPLPGEDDHRSTYLNAYCGSYGLAKNTNNTKSTPCIIMVDVNGDRKPNPPRAFLGRIENQVVNGAMTYEMANQNFAYSYVGPDSKKVNDIFSIMITEKEAIPFGVVAQRAMYKK